MMTAARKLMMAGTPADGGNTAPTFVAAGSVYASTVGAAPNLPAGIQSGDLLLWHITTQQGTAAATTGDWALLAHEYQSDTGLGASARASHGVYWVIYDGTDPGGDSAAIGIDSGHLTRVTAWRGVDQIDPFDDYASSKGTGATSHTATGVTPTTAETLIVASLAHGDGGTMADCEATDPATFTQAFQNTTNVGSDHMLSTWYATKDTTGTTGDVTWTTTASENSVGIIMALRGV